MPETSMLKSSSAAPPRRPAAPAIVRLWQSEIVRVGEFVAPLHHPSFSDSGPMTGYNVVFPNTRLRLRRSDGHRHWSDPAVINFYNDGDGVERTGSEPSGDCCSWLEIRPSLLEALAERLRASSAGRLFRRHQAPSDPRAYLRIRQLIVTLRNEPNPDALQIEETSIELVDTALRSLETVEGSRALPPRSSRPTAHGPGSRAPAGNRPRSDALLCRVEDSRELLSAHFNEPLGLLDIARAVDSSPFHLARGFRASTGMTLHQYRTRLRLHHAIERLLDGEADLSALAHDLGFSSHSHFSAAFRRHVGRTPSSVRALPEVPGTSDR